MTTPLATNAPHTTQHASPLLSASTPAADAEEPDIRGPRDSHSGGIASSYAIDKDNPEAATSETGMIDSSQQVLEEARTMEGATEDIRVPGHAKVQLGGVSSSPSHPGISPSSAPEPPTSHTSPTPSLHSSGRRTPPRHILISEPTPPSTHPVSRPKYPRIGFNKKINFHRPARTASPESVKKKKQHPKGPGHRASFINVLKFSWLNVLLIFIPISWACHFAGLSDTVVFCTSFGAILPLAAVLGFATEQLAIRVGDTLGGLLNATFGNAVELIVAILALVKGELRIVQSSMLGSILSNCLLVLGMCYFAGGLRFHELNYAIKHSQLNINLLGLAVTAIVIPVAYHVFLDSSSEPLDQTNDDVLKMSRGIAIILLIVYVGYLIFQFWTHSYLYAPDHKRKNSDIHIQHFLESQANASDGPLPPNGHVFRLPQWASGSDSDAVSVTSTASGGRDFFSIITRRSSMKAERGERADKAETGEKTDLRNDKQRMEPLARHSKDLGPEITPTTTFATDTSLSAEKRTWKVEDKRAWDTRTDTIVEIPLTAENVAVADRVASKGPYPRTVTTTALFPPVSRPASPYAPSDVESQDSPEEHLKMNILFSVCTLVVVTVLTGVTAEWLVSSINGLTASGNISQEFVALILLPLVGNAAEHVSAVTVAAKDRLDLSMAIAVGSSIQIALFVIPLLILLGWIIGQPLTLFFDVFETVVLFVSIIAVNWAIADGRTNWLEGFILMIIYVIIALVFWFYPGDAVSGL